MNTRKRNVLNLGFSLVEMLVVVSIFLIITGVVVFSQDKFSSNISLSNVSYEVALKIRQTQVYGILVRQGQGTGIDSFKGAYGVHFAKSVSGITFLTYADNPAEGSQKLSFATSESFAISDEILSTHALEEGNVIKDVCTYGILGDSATKKCFSGEGIGTIDTADIVFKRPDPAAIISDSSGGSNKAQIDIIISSALGDKKRTIKVFGSGQISVYAY